MTRILIATSSSTRVSPSSPRQFPFARIRHFPRRTCPRSGRSRVGPGCRDLPAGPPDKYLLAHFDILEGKVKGERYPAPFTEGAEIDLGAHLGRWVVAGRGSSVGRDAQVEDSVLHEGAKVGSGAVVRSSILGRGSVVGEGARLTRCVLGEGTVVAAGSELSEAKVPEG